MSTAASSWRLGTASWWLHGGVVLTSGGSGTTATGCRGAARSGVACSGADSGADPKAERAGAAGSGSATGFGVACAESRRSATGGSASVGSRGAVVVSVKSGPVDGVGAISVVGISAFCREAQQAALRSSCGRGAEHPLTRWRGIGITTVKVKDERRLKTRRDLPFHRTEASPTARARRARPARPVIQLFGDGSLWTAQCP